MAAGTSPNAVGQDGIEIPQIESRTTAFNSLTSVLLSNMNHRALINLPPMDYIIRHRQQRHTSKHHHAIIHRLDSDLREEREEANHSRHDQIAQRERIDGHRQLTERPASRGEFLAAYAFGEDAGDADKVGDGAGAREDTNEAVEDGCAAEVEQGEDDGKGEGEDGGVEGDGDANGCDLEELR